MIVHSLLSWEESFMRDKIQSVSKSRLNTELFPYKLYVKAKKFGIWNPEDIDFSQDRLDWETLTEAEKKNILIQIAQFAGGEEAVTIDLLPLVMTIAKEGRLEEEMYLTTFLFEEAKHLEFFTRFLEEVVGSKEDLSRYHNEAYKKIFYEELPAAMERLAHDQSPEAQAIASTTYNMVVEGIMAETGYHAFYSGVGKLGKLPGLLEGISLLKMDESRHISYGTYLLQRLIKEHGDHIYNVITNRINELMPLCIGSITNGKNPDEHIQSRVKTFGVDNNDMLEFAKKQMNVRLDILKRARENNLEEVLNIEEEPVLQ